MPTLVPELTPTAAPIQQQATASTMDPLPTTSPIDSAEATVPVSDHDKGKKKANTDPQHWTVGDVASWLKNRGFEEDVCNRFTSNHTDGQVLSALTLQNLKDEFGIESFGIRTKIKNAIDELGLDDIPPSKKPRFSSPPLRPPSDASLRGTTVSALYDRVNKYGFVQVRGTSASGKTTLAQLLGEHIKERDPTVNIIWVNGWPQEEVAGMGGWRHFLKQKGWIERERTVFILDEAQLSYADWDFWNGFFKSMHDFRDRRAIAFVSYGNPTSPIDIEGTPITMVAPQRVTLRPISHDDGLPSVGLFFSQEEFNDLVSKRYPPKQYFFHSSFFDAILLVTGGHIGAISDFMGIITAHYSYRKLKYSADKRYTWDSFMEMVSPRECVDRLEKSSRVFPRGLPRNKDLQDPAIAKIFSTVLRMGYVEDAYFTADDDKKALRECFRHGWLHTDNLGDIGLSDTVGYFFPSSLHRWFVEWKLWDTIPAVPFQAVDILTFVVDVISKFSPRLLSAERRIGPGCIQRPPEAHFQDEFYRCCHECSNGSLVTFPEFGTAKGRVDFYIPSQKWGVELLRDGDQLAKHSGWFSKKGKYTKTLPLSDYIILDCRRTRPTRAHRGMAKLYHVVFSDEFRSVSILNSELNPVQGGEMNLLASS